MSSYLESSGIWLAKYAMNKASSSVEAKAEELYLLSSRNGELVKDRALEALRGLFESEKEDYEDSEEQKDPRPSAVRRLLTGLFATKEGVACVSQLILEDLYGMEALDIQLKSPEARKAVLQELSKRVAKRFSAAGQDKSSQKAATALIKETQVLAQTLFTEFGKAFSADDDFAVDLTTDKGRYSFVNRLVTGLISKQLAMKGPLGAPVKPEEAENLLDILNAQLSLLARQKLASQKLRIDLSSTDTVLRSVLDLLVASVAQEKTLCERDCDAFDKSMLALFSKSEGLSEKAQQAATLLARACVDKLKARAKGLTAPLNDEPSDRFFLDRALINRWVAKEGEEPIYLGLLRSKREANPVYVTDKLLERYLSSVFLGSFGGAQFHLLAQRGKHSLEDHLLSLVSAASRELFDVRKDRDGPLAGLPQGLGETGQRLAQGIFTDHLNAFPMHQDMRDYAETLIAALVPLSSVLDDGLSPVLRSVAQGEELRQAMARGVRKARRLLESQGSDVYDVLAWRNPKLAAEGVEPASTIPAYDPQNPVDRELHETAKRLLKKVAGQEGLGLLNEALINNLKDFAGHDVLAAILPRYGTYVKDGDNDAAFDVLIEAVAQLINLPGRLRSQLRKALVTKDGQFDEDLLFSRLFDSIIPEAKADGASVEEVKADAKAEQPGKQSPLELDEELAQLLKWFRGLGQDSSVLATVFRVLSRVILRYLAEVLACLAALVRLDESWARLRKATSKRTDRRMSRLGTEIADKRLLPLRSAETAHRVLRVCVGTVFPQPR